MKKTLAAFGLAIAIDAHAQAFVEIGGGATQFDVTVSSSGEIDDSDVTWTIGAGYMVLPKLGFDASYRDLGRVDVKGRGFFSRSSSADVDGFSLGVVGRLPITGQLILVPRIGLYIWDSNVKGGEGGDGGDPYVGVGVDYAFSRLFAGIHYAHFKLGGDAADVFELRLGYRF